MKLPLKYFLILVISIKSFLATINISMGSSEVKPFSTIENYIKISVLKFPHFDMILSDEKVEKYFTLNQILQEAGSTFSVKTFAKLKPTRSKFVLILYDGFDQFRDFSGKLLPEYFELSGCFTIIFSELSETLVEEVFKVMWTRSFFNVNVLIEMKLQIFSYVPFHDKKCRDMTPTVVSEFINGSWTSFDFFPGKFANMHNCTIKASAMINPPNVIKKVLPGGGLEFDGIEVTIIRAAARVLNFHVAVENNDTDYGLIFVENNTATGNMRRAISGDSDMILGSYYMQSLRARYLSPTQVYRLDPTKYVGSQNPAFSSVEKLMRPFSLWLFIALLGTLLSGFFCVFMLRKLYKTDSTMQLLNLLAIFLGVSLKTIPKKIPFQIVFVYFALFSLVIRTVYQGSLFRQMQTDDRKQGVTSLDEMVEKKFTFHLSDSFGQTTKDMKFYSRFVDRLNQRLIAFH